MANFVFIFLMLFLFSCATVQNRVETVNNGEDFYTKGVTALGTGNYLEAETYFQKALRCQYNPAGANYYLGLIKYKLGNLDAALKYLTESVSLNNKITDAHNTLGAIYAEKKEYRKAIEEFKIVLQDKTYLFPENALYNLALLYYNLREFDNSILYCKKSLKVVPKSPAVYYLIALNLYEKGLKRECFVLMNDIIKEYKNTFWADKSKEFLKKYGVK